MRTVAKKWGIGLLALILTVCAFGFVGTVGAARAEEKTDITDKIVVWDDANQAEHDYTEIRLLLNSGTLDFQGYINDGVQTKVTVDLCEYLYIGVGEGESYVEHKVRDLLNANKNGDTSYKGADFPLSMGGEFAPVTVQYAGGDIVIRILKEFVPYGEFNLRLKTGFEVDVAGKACVIGEDIVYGYANGNWTRKYDITWVVGDRETKEIHPTGSLVPEFTGSTDKESTVDKVFTFIGWSPEPGPVNAHATYTAQYSEATRQYDVTIGDAAPVKVDYGAKLQKPEDPTKAPTNTEVFTFDKWVIDGTETAWNFETDTVKGDTVLKAVFTSAERKYSVTFDGKDEQKVSYDSTITKPSSDPTKPSDAQYDYAFDGWYNGDTKWNFETDKVRADLALTSKFAQTLRSYEITIAFEGIEKESVTLTLEYGAQVDFTPYKVAGYDFKIMNGEEEITSLTVTGETSLKLVYAPRKIAVSFDANGGTGSMAAMEIPYGVETALTKNSLTRTGYTFAGWATNAAGEVVYADRAKVNLTSEEDVTLYAVWTKNSYQVTYEDENGETVKESATVAFGDSVDLTAPTAPEGKTFDGWYYNGEKVTSLTMPADDVVLVAKFADKAPEKGGCGGCGGSSSAGMAGLLTLGLAAVCVIKWRF